MRKRILVVDDDRMNLERTRVILQKTYEVLLAESGWAALGMLHSERVDLILLEKEMPGLSGIETFKRMQTIPVHCPVMFLTASGDREDVENAIRLGAANYLIKPFLPQELLRRVAQELERR